MPNQAIIYSRLAIAKARMAKGQSAKCKQLHRDLGKGEKCPECGNTILTPIGGDPVSTGVSKAPRTFSAEQRDKLAGKGQAMDDGSFPIPDRGALRRAIQSIGRAKNPDMVKAHIVKRAKALHAEDMLPEGWA